jgi:anaerobic nitric oxide reductase transcription regulator
VVVEIGHLDLEPEQDSPEPAARAIAGRPEPPLRDRVDAFQRSEIRAALDAAAGNWAQAARSLGLHRGNLHRLAARLGLR